jgi:hypothetical protein
LIVVGQVVSVTRRETTTLELPGGPVAATRSLAQLRVDRQLKGNVSSKGVSLEFVVPDAPGGFRGVASGQYGMFFLKATPNTFNFSDPIYPSLPAVLNASVGLGSALDRVTIMLGKVLMSSNVAEYDRSEALDVLGDLATPLALKILEEAMKQASGGQRLVIAAKLVARNDLAGLSTVEGALVHRSELSTDQAVDLAGSLGGLKDPRSIPTLTRLVKIDNAAVRRNAAVALRNSGASAALEPLSLLLEDRDIQVRYYAVVGLGEITHQDDWTPAFDEFREHEIHYLSHWRAWAAGPTK